MSTKTPEVATKASRIALLTEHAERILGSKRNAEVWMKTPNIALGMVRPKDKCANLDGFYAAGVVLSAIEYGVFS